MTVQEARATAKDTSVREARKVALGHWPSEGARSLPFKSLKHLKRGLLSRKLAAGKDALPKPNLRPPGHSEEHLIDFGKTFERHPVLRYLQNLERLVELEDRRKNGKSPPKKGAGKGAGKKGADGQQG